ncbi:sugar transferase [Salinimicrobium sp. TH3]|uniref:sugar transferase n=1 Tax=Salinimicrobium sp. TH3 TaxID=2997342 RepID=UPI002276DD9F|nr:sugar transferase [Salinimicrobium sp. TH3]MCY2686979.1 sugar transferase [Salinimicrobium sp. TH3]
MYRIFFKHLIDFLLSFFGFIFLLPIFILITILLAIYNGGNPFFMQIRPGKNARLFKIIKFKTMSDARDDEGNLLPDSDRLTFIGRIVRKTSLDEIPQLINVIKGDMSLIGPRPLLPEYLDHFSNFEMQRHKVRPGITGLAAVKGRNSISWQKKFEYDVWYVDNVSMWMDIKILWWTMLKVLKSEGVNSAHMSTAEPFKGNN